MVGCLLLALTQHYGLPTISPAKRVERTSADVVAELRRRYEEGASLRQLAAEVGMGRRTVTNAIRAERG